MKWRGGRLSDNVEDRRGQRVSRGVKVGGGGGLLLVLLVLLLGGDPSQVLQLLGGTGAAPPPAASPGPRAEDEEYLFMSSVLALTEEVWSEIFAASGSDYREPTLVLFTDAVESGCGFTTAQTGPFYCPADQKLYLDTSFFEQLARMGGSGDFAAAYVVGHEVGHHIQTLTGISSDVRRLQSSARNQAEGNRLQVLMELQADCYAGVFAHHANRRRRVLEAGDVQEGLAAAAAIGDDRLSGGRAAPESFTHGSSEERSRWLLAGIESGSVAACDTFGQAGG
jgi:predicted metalloprotease